MPIQSQFGSEANLLGESKFLRYFLYKLIREISILGKGVAPHVPKVLKVSDISQETDDS